MIVVSVDARGVPLPGWQGLNFNEIGALLHCRAQFAQLGGHGGDAIGFLDAPTGDVGQARGGVGIQRHHRQRHRRVGNVVAIQGQALQRPGASAHLQPPWAPSHLSAHGLGRFNKADVALNGIQSHTLDAYRLIHPSNRPQRHEVGR